MAWYWVVLIIVQALGMIWAFKTMTEIVHARKRQFGEGWYDSVKDQPNIWLKFVRLLWMTYVLVSMMVFATVLWEATVLAYIFWPAGKQLRQE